MDRSDVVIVGGVAAGPKTGAVLARRLPNARITLFEKGEVVSLASCGLPYFASGDIESAKKLTTTSYGVKRDLNFFKATKGFDVRTGMEITTIDRKMKSVSVRNVSTGETFQHGYDKLVLATGASPAKPPFPVVESSRIRNFSRLQDAVDFRVSAEKGQIGKAVVVGAGFIGCEVVEACAGLWGIETVLIEKEHQLLPYALDPEMAAIAQREMERNGVSVLTGCGVEKIDLREGKPIVHVAGQEAIEADYVFLCLGVAPNTSLARDCGLDLGLSESIKVDSHMRTSDPCIFAGGDCVESYNIVTNSPVYMPMGSIANRHGRVIAENLAGNDVTFHGVVGSLVIKVFDINLGSTGVSVRTLDKLGVESSSVWGSFPDKPDYYPGFSTMTIKLTYEPGSDRLLGLQAAGKGDICRRVDVCSSFLQRRSGLSDLLDFEQGYAPPYAEAIDPLHHLASAALAQKRGIEFVGPDMEVDSDGVYLDVREASEQEESPFRPGGDVHLVSMPLGELRNRLGELDRDSRMFIICRRGARSYQAAHILKHAGFASVKVIGGGTQALE